MLDNIPEVKKSHDEKTMLFGTVDSWLVYVRTLSLKLHSRPLA